MNNVPDNVVDLAKHLEGLPGGKPALKPYLDQAGVATNGYGHTEGVTMQSPDIDDPTATANLINDLDVAAEGVDHLVKVPVTPNQRGALILFVLNEGEGALASSTLLKLLNSGNYDGALKQFDEWVYYHDRQGVAHISDGLQARRATEKALWLTPISGSTPAPEMARTHDTGSAAVPVPAPTSAIQTTTGKGSAGAAVTGGVTAALAGVSYAQQISDAFHAVISMQANLPQTAQVAMVCTIVVSILFSVYVYWRKHQQVKTENT